MAVASVEDVTDRLPPGEFVDENYVEQMLADAELLLLSKIPDLLIRIAQNQIDHDVVVMVEANMVLRVVRNPEGFTQETDGNYSYTSNRAVASGLLEVLDSEWSLLGHRSGFKVLSFEPPAPWCQPTQMDPAYWFQYYTVV